MASKIGDLYWQVDADTKKLDASLKGTEKTAQGTGKTFTSLAKGIVAGLGVAVVAGIGKMSMALIDAASEAEETRNKFDVVYRDIAEAAEAAAENLADNFGLSGTAARSLLADTGDLLTGFGFTQESALDLSDQVNQLAVDLASFTNFSGGAKGASDALTKALLGERESVKALGISILDEDVKAKVLLNTKHGLTFETERQAKAYATLQIAQEQSQNAIGDFERSIDSYANQTRIAEANVSDLQVAMGDFLLPTATKGVKVFNSLTVALTNYAAAAATTKEVTTDLRDGTLDTEQSLDDLKIALEKVEKLNRSASGQGRFKDDIATLKTLIDTYGIEDTFLAKREGYIASEKANSDAIAATAAAEAERLRLLNESTEAIDLLDQRRIAALSTEEKELENLQTQIDYWAEFRDTVPGAQQLLNDLVKERNELTKEEIEAEKELYDGRQTQYEADVIFRQAIADAQARHLADIEAEQAAIDALADRYASMGQIGLSVIGSVGEALGAGEDAWSAFAKSGINAIAGVIDSLAQQMLAQAASLIAASFFSGGVSLVGVGPALAGAAAASLAAGALRGYAGSFEQGGVIPQPPGVPATGDNMLARVNPGEVITPRDEATGSNNYIFEFDGDILAHLVIDKRVNKGRFPIDTSRGLR